MSHPTLRSRRAHRGAWTPPRSIAFGTRCARVALLSAGLLATGCDAPGRTAGDEAASVDVGAPGRVAISTGGMVVTGSAPATTAGVEILEAGGNAIDAAVATAFALAVAEPTQSGLGGRTQALVRGPNGAFFGVDATTAVPAGYDPDSAPEVEDGYAAVGVPGTVAGLERLHAEGGSLPWASLLEPAIRLAAEGFTLSEGEAGRIAGIRDRLARSEGARTAFLREDGSAYGAGEVLRQPELAAVLRTVAAEGGEAFYRGAIAERMASDFAAAGAFVTAADLAAYRAEPSLVVHGRFGALELFGTYLPASGATTIEALQILERVGVEALDPDQRAMALGQALLAAFEDRETARADARPPEEDAAWVTSAAQAERRAEGIRASLGSSMASRAVALSVTPDDEPAQTTHVSIVDSDGMAVAMTQSLGPTGGARVASPGLGFLYAATLGGYLGRVLPGDRPWSSQSPLVAVREGRTSHVMGGAGARRIISALVATLVRLEVDGLSLEEAMAAPRLHPAGSGWTFEQGAEGVEPPGAAAARARGIDVQVDPFGVFFARLNVIAVDPAAGTVHGVADPRWRWGAAAGSARTRTGEAG